jgi:ribosome biogenesis GTPase
LTAQQSAAAGGSLGRVIAAFGRRYLVALDPPAEPDAAQRQRNSPLSLEVDALPRGRRMDVVVGDRVRCSRERDLYVIESVEARRNLLFRSDANRTKPLAANVGQIAIVFAAQPAPQREFIWRALLAARSAGVPALAILNKIDLPSAAAEAMLEEAAALGAVPVRVSARGNPEGARQALSAHCAGRATLLVGQSGMGKSTLLNLLIGAQARTGALTRRGAHGRQTTTATRWFDYAGSGALIDSPGFHEFGLAQLAAEDLFHWMPDLDAVAGACRFADCRHADEPGCRIRAAVQSGAVQAERYAFYRKLCAEAQERVRAQRGF